MWYGLLFLLIGITIYEMVEAGLVFSLLIIALTTTVLVFYFKLKNRAAEENATAVAKTRFKVYEKTIVVVSAILHIPGWIMWLSGASNGRENYIIRGEGDVGWEMIYAPSTSMGFLLVLITALIVFVIILNKKGVFD